MEQMECIIPWNEWMESIRPHYYSGERGNKPYELEIMLRIHLLRELYDPVDMAVMNEDIDSLIFVVWTLATRCRMEAPPGGFGL